MTRRHPVNTRQSWDRFTWLSVSKECRKRGYYPDTDAYDEKGLLRESACHALYRTHAYYGQHPARYGAIDAMPVLRSKYGVVTIQWATAKQHKRQQRIADSST
ncbi:hypothetical protein D6D13_05666 [Aureobasidium pullulans]|uniref:Uncharacterized protein n=1 Tax=Aureobasidium pullulans TaxID=5580 RepID=A0A4S9CRB4_AURPU|nr:hypothetical protein D6D13_05666 [Aureobasidium pullulans]